jgi:transcriptional regulator with XRE-family HTH domain
MWGTLEVHTFVRKRIEEARTLAGYNKAEMARLMKMTKQTYLKLENGGLKSIDVTYLVQMAAVTGRDVSFFLSESSKGDLVTAIRQSYPDLTTASLGEVLDFARDLQKRDRYAHSGDNRASDTSNVHTGDTGESEASS